MFKHNLVVIYRNFKRYKGSFFINLIGLSTGLACALLIYLWVNDELSIDEFNKNDSQLFQILSNSPSNNGIQTDDPTPGLLANVIAQETPEVEHAVAVIPPVSAYEGVLSANDSYIKVKPQFADKDYFNVFTLNFIQGDKANVLSDKSAVSISEALALKLYHTTENVIGKTVKFKNQYFDGLYTVSGIFNPPFNSSSLFDVLFSYELFLEKRPEVKDWKNGGPSTFLTLKKGTDIAHFNKKLTDVIKSKRKSSEETLFIQRFSERYLYGIYENGRAVGGRIIYVYLFSLIALFILAIACINFINISTAKASRRMKEVGIKKTIGASRKTLVFQHLGESIFTVFISLAIAVLLTALFLPHFNEITAKQLHLSFNLNLVLSILGIGVFTGLAAGSYPAFYISGFDPVDILKGKSRVSVAELLVRKGLVIFQFAISVLLIIFVLVIYKQIQFIQTKNLGYNKNNIISLIREGKIEENFQAFIARVKNIPGVENASYMYGDLTGGASSRSGGLSWVGQNPQEKPNTTLDISMLILDF